MNITQYKKKNTRYSDSSFLKKVEITSQFKSPHILMLCYLNMTDSKSEIIKEEFDRFQKIAKNQDLFRQMFQHSVIPIVLHDMDMNIYDVNDSALIEFGYTKEEFLEMSVFALHPEDELEHSKEVKDNMSREQKLSIETRFARKDGTTFFALATPCKFMLDDQPLIHVYIQNIDYQKEAQKAVLAFNKKLKDQNKELEQFAYTAAHDLKAPLKSISSFADILNSELDSLDIDSETIDQVTIWSKRILEIVEKTDQLISNILSYSRIGKTNEDIEIVDLNEVLKKVLENYHIEIEQGDVDINSEKLPIINSKQVLMYQLLQNMIDNSFKFRQKDRALSINISATQLDKGWNLSIEDNGIGISEDARKKVFKLFQRGTSSSDNPGTGIGLTICNKIINLHNGSIEIQKTSSFDQGTKFLIYIEDMQNQDKDEHE